MKKIIFILFLLTILTINVQASSAAITEDIPAKNVLIGDQYYVTVSLEANPGFASVQAELSYDHDVVQCVKVIPGEMVSGMLSVTNPHAAGTQARAILVAASTRNINQNGKLVTFVFDKPQSGEPNFSFKLTEIRNEHGEDVSCDIVTINNYVDNKPNDGVIPNNPSDGSSTTPPTPNNPSGGGTSSDLPQDIPTVYPPFLGETILPWWDTAPDTTPTVPEETRKPVLPPAFQDELMKPIVSFTDVSESHWAKDYIEEAAARSVINGYPDGTFHPDTDMTRAEIFTILWNLSDKPMPSGDSPFADVGYEDWYYHAAVWAHENGYTDEETTVHFKPHEIINREQVIAILYRYAGRPKAEYILHPYEDADAVSDFALSAMNWAVSQGIIVGMDATHLVPQGAITRAQITTIAVRYIHYVQAQNP